jgi:hypothetical protein
MGSGFGKKLILALLVVLVIGVFAAYGFLRYTEGKIDRIEAH